MCLCLSSCDNNKDIIKVGVLFPMTGYASETILNVYSSLEMCVDNWNQNGGVDGKKIELIPYDTKGEVKTGIMQVNKMISIDKPQIVLSAISSIALAVTPILEKNEIIHMTMVGTDRLFEVPTQFTIRNFLTVNQTSHEIIKKILNDFKKHQFHFFYPNNDQGLSGLKVVNEYVKKGQISALSLNSYTETDKDYRNIIQKAQINDEDIVYVVGIGNSLGRLVKQIRQSGFSGKIIGAEELASPGALSIIGNEKSDMYYVELFPESVIEKFNKDYYQRYGNNASDFAIIVYNGLNLLLSKMNEEGTSNNLNIIECLQGSTFNSAYGDNKVINNEIVYSFSVNSLK